MIDAQTLLRDLKRVVRELEKDLREHHADSEQGRAIAAEWEAAHAAGRTAHGLEAFRADAFTQAAVHWVLACTFLRFIEDNELVERPWLAGPGGRMALARDRHVDYFRRHPRESDVDYLLAAFKDAAALPGLAGLFHGEHNPLFRLPVSADGARGLLGFLQKQSPDTGALVHDFTDPEWSTRFLGDLYQNLSEAARKRYALLQTPQFVERFILERTLDPALAEFGLKEVRLIDPACGSGHFLLGAFERLFGLWVEREPGLNVRAAAQRALEAIAGVDINPFAAEIARFRLLLAALRASDVPRLKGAPDFEIHVAVGDSLLHGRRFGQLDLGDNDRLAKLRAHRYASEDNGALTQILSRPYHAVVANPPYTTPKDPAENAAYRELYTSCHKQYALAVPFIERCFDLAVDGRLGTPGGFVGVIVGNNFMKRDFGEKLIEDFLPTVDLTHVVDTSGIPLPGHGTPTVILLGRNRAPIESTVRAVMRIRGEPDVTGDPAQGIVWSAIRAQVDRPGSESPFVSVADTRRQTFQKHPWTIGGGGATELLSAMSLHARTTVQEHVTAIGRTTHTGADSVYFASEQNWRRKRIGAEKRRTLVEGDSVRDWQIEPATEVLFPYDSRLDPELGGYDDPVFRHFWQYKQFLIRRREPNGTHAEIGLTWFEWSRFQRERYVRPLSITFAFVATHNHFSFDRSSKVFKQSAPAIKLPERSSEKDHLALLGLLNSSIGSFWIRQVCHSKGAQGVNEGGKSETWEQFLEVTGTALLGFPLTAERPTDLAGCVPGA